MTAREHARLAAHDAVTANTGLRSDAADNGARRSDAGPTGAFPSLWSAAATPALETPPLHASRRVDVAVIGGGFTGVSAALHLAEAGVDVCVLDAGEPGWGASGRNGGQVIPGLKHDPDALMKCFPGEQGVALVDMIGGAADVVFDLIARYGIDCDARREGWIQPAHSAAMLAAQRIRVAQWHTLGAPVEMLDRDAVTSRIGSPIYQGGWIDRRAGSLHPLNYLRGLVRAATGQGATIHGNTRVTGLRAVAGRWQVSTSSGHTLDAARVLIATNGYTGDLWPGLRRTLIAANSFIVATAPLPEHIAATVLPGGEVASDARRLLLYFRKDAAGRLLLGGRGSFSDPNSPSAWQHLERALVRLFPQTQGVPIEYRWAGRVAVTPDAMPHVHTPAPGLTISLGYNGRGIAMATTLGRELAGHLAGRSALRFPVTPIRPIPFHSLQRLYFSAAVNWYRVLDRLS